MGCALLVWLLLATAAHGTATIHPDDIRPGMKGYGLSVFSGRKVERFEVEIIDVMRQITPKGDMILCRLSGMGLKEAGIIAGMSGSPVYIEGKLAGAVAYGWNFSKEPIAGVTPIGEMLELWEQPGTSGAPGLRLEGRKRGGLSTLSVPVALSGYSSRLADVIGPALDEYGLLPVAATGGRSARLARTGDGSLSEEDRAALDASLVPGGPIGVVLIDGDVWMSAIGTITHREGDKVLAFGHPMFQAGAVEMPLCAGVIHTILPSLASSFKLFSAGEPVGTMTQDRLPGIGGVIGPIPAMIPVEVSIRSPSTTDEYRFSVMDYHLLASLLTAIGLTDIIYSTEGVFEEMTLRSTLSITVEDTTRLAVHHLYTGEDPASELFYATVFELRTLLENRFRPVKLTGLEFELAFSPGREQARIISARPDRWTARPGDTVAIALVLQDWQGRETKRLLDICLPPSTPAGQLTVVIASRDSLWYRETMRIPGLTEPNSLAALFQLVERSGPENEMVVAGYIPHAGIALEGRELPMPPPSVRAVVLGGNSAESVQTTTESLLFEETFPLDGLLTGVAEFNLEVRR